MIRDQLIVFIVIAFMVFALIREMHRPGIILLTALAIFLITDIVETKEAISGFSNQGVLIIAMLFMISEGVRASGILKAFSETFLPLKRQKYPRMYFSILAPIGAISAILNNTPIVLIFAPVIKNWSERLKMEPSRFLMPLSFITILGGTLTIIGTTTNLLVHGLLLENNMPGLGFFETGRVGIFIFLAGLIYLVFFSNRLLKKVGNNEDFRIEKLFFFEAVISQDFKPIGKEYSTLKVGILKDISLVAVIRNGEYIQDYSNLIISDDDKLLLNTSLLMLESLRNIKGLSLYKLEQAYEHHRNSKLETVEAILSPRFPGIGKKLSETDFLNRYNSVVLAIYRNGDQIYQEMDNVRLKEGDTLLLLTDNNFVPGWIESQVFYLLTHKGDIQFNVDRKKALFTYFLLALLLGGTILTTSMDIFENSAFNPLLIATVIMLLMVWLNILPAQKYTKAVNWDILITIASSIGISHAIQNSGLSETIAGFIHNNLMVIGPLSLLFVLYIITAIITEVVTNNAAAALIFPIALSISEIAGLNPRPFVITICIAASASFISPIGYQTNLIVQSIGQYKYTDFSRLGLPLSLLIMVITVLLIPVIWNF
jgi:di/tricarboxylate transporter